METLQPNGQNSPVNEPKRLNAGEGVTWFTEAWGIFKKNKLLWITAVFVSLIIANLPTILITANLLENQTIESSTSFDATSFVFSIFSGWLTFCFLGGMMKICKQVEQGEGFRFGSLFSALSSQKSGRFLILLLWSCLFSLAFTLLMMIPTAFVFKDAASPAAIFEAMQPLFFIIILLFLLLISMLFWLTPPLLMLEDMKSLAAIKTSFTACRRNIPALLVYGLIWVGIGIAIWVLTILFSYLLIFLFASGIITADMINFNFGNNPVLIFYTAILGMFAVSSLIYPMMFIGMYTSYRSIFPEGRLNRQ